MYKRSFRQKLTALILSIVLLTYSTLTPLGAAVVIAQETTEPTPTQEVQQPQEQQSNQATDTSPTPTPTVDQGTTTQPTDTVTPTPSVSESPATPTPTPTMTQEQYDAYKVEKEAEDNAREVREDEWEAHEEDDAWIAAHGGNQEYFLSGQWQKDEDARKAAEEEAARLAAAQQQQSAQATGDQSIASDTNNDSSISAASTDGSSSIAASGDGNNTAISTDTDNASIANANTASITNDSTAGGISGENTQSQNDGDTQMQTGEVKGEATLVNNGNQNVSEVDSINEGEAAAQANGSFAQGADAENLNTGEDSTNLAVANETETLSGENINDATVDNQMTVEGVSGDNTITENDGGATLTTGDIELIANLLNILNLNITGDDFLHLIVNIFGQLNGDLDLDSIAQNLGYSDDDALEVIARNQNTGDDSTNTAIASKEENTDVNNTNNATVNNEMNVSGVSGGNNVSQDDGDVNVVTGRIQILANMLNFINSNFTGEKWKFIMVNVFGSLTGDIFVPSTNQYVDGTDGGGVLAENTTAGDGSTSDSSASSLNQTSVANANGVTLNNSINANGISGENEQSYNDGPATTNSGTVDVASQILNFLNFNITGNNWVFLIVNVMGTWMGQIVGFGDTPIAATEGTFAALSVGGTSQAGATPTTPGGEDSVNSATASLVENTNVNNSNTATVNNTMNIDGVSGQNTANGNDGTTSVTTGWVEIDANLLNIINMNVTGRNWMIVFLNIFGDFAGNLFFGKPPVPQIAATDTDTTTTQDQDKENDQQDQHDDNNDTDDDNNNPNTPPNQNNNQNNAQGGVVAASNTKKSNTLLSSNTGGNIVEDQTATNDDLEYVVFESSDGTPQPTFPSWAFFGEKLSQFKSFLASFIFTVNATLISFLNGNIVEAKGGEQ